jgi:hypothetical protein
MNESVAGIVQSGQAPSANTLASSSDMLMLLIVFSVMVASGAIGGLISFFISGTVEDTSRTVDYTPLSWWRHIVIGIGAALIIPLFLNSISAHLISDMEKDHSQIFVLIGFCLVAAITSRTFISTMSEKVFRELRANKREISAVKGVAEQAETKAEEANEKASYSQAAVSPLVEEDDVDQPPFSAANLSNSAFTLSEEQLKVLRALFSSKYTLRSISGISTETGLDRSNVNRIISELIKMGLADQPPTGQRKWFATKKGREVGVIQRTAGTPKG